MSKKKLLHIDERYMKVNLTLSIIIYGIVVPFCIYLSVDNYIHGKPVVARYALFCAVMTAIAVACFSICKFGKKKRDWLMHLAINIQCFVYWITFVFFLYTGGTDGSSIFLFFVAVPVVFYFFNLVYALYFSSVFFILMVIYMNTPLRYLGFQFPEVYYSRLPMMYLACVIMCAVAQYEIVKGRIKQEDALEAARQASEAKTDFLANTSHEIRTPINAVLGMNEMILRETDRAEKIKDSDPEAFRESFRKIRNYSGNVDSAGSNLLAIINDILDFTKIEEGRMDIVPTEYRLSAVLNDVSNMINFKAKQKNLTFITDVDKNLPDNLYGDVVRVRQAITNVLNNAVKYTDEGSVSLTVAGNEGEKTEDGKRTVRLVISVKDTGIGISEKDIGKLFGKFERVDLEKNSTKEGTGLGLAITKMLLEMMDGTITVESKYGKGSTFTITIPQIVLSDEPVGDFKETFEKTLGEKKSYHESFRAPEARVLAVDDTKMNLIVVTEFLRDTGINLDTAGGGREAIKLSLENKYDVILMDQRMPEMDGVETLNEIRKHKDGPNIDTPVICLTADAVVGARSRYISKGFNDYLTKPIDSVYLEAMLRKYIPAEKIEIITYEDDGHSKTSDSSADIYEKLRKAGVDTAAGIANCTGEDLYMTILAEYLNCSGEKITGLNNALADGDLNGYGVLIHSVKSTSATIGASEVSHIAQKLEKASNDKDIGLIRKEHNAFMDKYTGLLEVIKECVPADNNDDGGQDDNDVMEFAPEQDT